MPGTLVCDQCQAIVHASRLEALASRARAHEQQRELIAARDDWQSILTLLPADSSQATWVRGKVAELTRSIGSAPAKGDPHAWTRKLGPFAPLAALLLKGKFLLSLLKLQFLLSFVSFAGIYWALYGAKFGIGIAVLVLVHEFGHFVAVKRRGLRADLPVFIPGFGAYVRWSAEGVSASTRAIVSLAGPLAGLIGAACCALVWLQTQQGLWLGLASFSALINVLNLIPVWALDGGHAMVAIDRTGRIAIAVAAILFAAYFAQPLLLLVAAGAAYRAFEKKALPDIPPGYGMTVYFVILVGSLGYFSKLAPLGTTPQ
jgi:Zn-dependent protease